MKPTKRNNRGFSTLELIITLSISAVVMSVGAPQMADFLRETRLRSETFSLVRTIHLARSEAVKRQVPVVLCRSANITAATPECGGTHYVWTSGYLVFASGDANNTYEAATDDLIKIGLTAAPGISVRTNGTSNRNLEFNADGSTNESGGTARFAICDPRGGTFGRQVNVPPVGRPKIEKGTTSSPVNCTAPS